MIIRSDSSELGCLGVCSGDADQEPASAIQVNQWKWAFTELPKSGEAEYHVIGFPDYGCSIPHLVATSPFEFLVCMIQLVTYLTINLADLDASIISMLSQGMHCVQCQFSVDPQPQLEGDTIRWGPG